MITKTGYTRTNTRLVIDVIASADQFPDPSNPSLLIDGIVQHLFALPISDSLKTSLKVSSLLSGQASDHYWTDAWNIYKANPSDANAVNTVVTRLQLLLKTLMNAAEYQLS